MAACDCTDASEVDEEGPSLIYRKSLDRAPDCRDPDHPGCIHCWPEEEKEEKMIESSTSWPPGASLDELAQALAHIEARRVLVNERLAALTWLQQSISAAMEEDYKRKDAKNGNKA